MKKVVSMDLINLMRKNTKKGWIQFSKKYSLNYGTVRNLAHKYGIKSEISPKFRNIPRGKYSKPKLSEGKKYPHIKLTNNEFQVLLGSVLGDGCIFQNKTCYYPHFIETHSARQVDYLRWKFNYFKKFNPVIYKYKSTNQFSLVTKRNPYFSKWHNSFYHNGKKIIDKKLLNKLNPLGLAVWYMDDGHLGIMKHWKYKYLKYRRVIFNALCFSPTDYKIFKDIFHRKWGFDITIFKTGKYHAFYLKRKDTERFINIVKPYILPSLKYKIRGAYETKI